jgi:hypothetical protein
VRNVGADGWVAEELDEVGVEVRGFDEGGGDRGLGGEWNVRGTWRGLVPTDLFLV